MLLSVDLSNDAWADADNQRFFSNPELNGRCLRLQRKEVDEQFVIADTIIYRRLR